MTRPWASLASLLALIAPSIAPSIARADLVPPPAPFANPSAGGDGAAASDSRFGEIGHADAEAAAAETPPVSAGVAGTRVGRVTYAGARVDVPLNKTFSLIPQAALLHVSPSSAPGDRATFNPYIGGGVGMRPAPSWSVEASIIYGPMSYGIGSVGALAAVGKEIGGDWSRDIAPPVDLEIAVAATRFNWASGVGPAGPDVIQAYVQAQALLRVSRRFTVTPKGMLFAYDKSLDNATGEALGTVSTLARIGSYAPRAMIGARLAYLVGARVTPFVEGEEIWYAAGIGRATELLGGVRFDLGHDSYVAAFGGAIFNRVGGPLVPTDYELSTVPVIGTEIQVSF